MSTLALDLGTCTGWATGAAGAVVSGTWDLKPRRFEGGGMRFLRFRGHLDEIHKLRAPALVVFEEVRRHAGTDAAHVYGGLLGVLSAWCEDKSVPYRGVPVQAIKKFATGKGNAGKPAMIAAMQKLGYRPADDNEADAIALLLGAIQGAV